jgi:hypothetical protein
MRHLYANEPIRHGILHELATIVNVQFPHQVEFVCFDCLDAKVQFGSYHANRSTLRKQANAFLLSRGQD